MMANMTWDDVIATEKKKDYFAHLDAYIEARRQVSTVYPKQENVYTAFSLCPLACVRVVIIGQDPYHGAGQANGLAFSVPQDVRIPPSLANVYRELKDDMGIARTHGDLSGWARQGALLLNSVLTVEEGTPGAHQKQGWEVFTDAVIQAIHEQHEHVVFLLWGKYAQEKGADIDTQKHTAFVAPHPSPLSAHRGFFGCRHFSKANEALVAHGQPGIDWGK